MIKKRVKTRIPDIASDEWKHSMCPVIFYRGHEPPAPFITAGLKQLSPDLLRQVRFDSLAAELHLFLYGSLSCSRCEDQVLVSNIFMVAINHIQGIEMWSNGCCFSPSFFTSRLMNMPQKTGLDVGLCCCWDFFIYLFLVLRIFSLCVPVGSSLFWKQQQVFQGWVKSQTRDV